MTDAPDAPAAGPALWFRWAATLAVGALGGAAAQTVGAPLPWLLGAMVATAGVASAGLRPFGGPPVFPFGLRMAFIPVIGVLIGAAMTPEVLRAAPGWIGSAALVLPFVAGSHALCYLIYRRLGGLDRATAFFSAMPGGLLESIELGGKAGADERALTTLQFARIAVVVTLLPLIVVLIEGRAVGSAAGARIEAAPMGPVDALVLTAAGVLGVWGARRLRLPAGQILGPVIASALAHVTGLTAAAPPDWLVSVAQLVIGVSLGQRFVGMRGAALWRCLALALAGVAAMLALGAALAAAALALLGTPFTVTLIGLAPGGVVEMGLIALSLAADPIFVTFLHLVRIIATVWLAVWAWPRLRANKM